MTQKNIRIRLRENSYHAMLIVYRTNVSTARDNTVKKERCRSNVKAGFHSTIFNWPTIVCLFGDFDPSTGL
jgi:hypothetical protein